MALWRAREKAPAFYLVNAGHHCTEKHLYYGAPGLSGTFSLDRHVSTAPVDRVVNPEASGKCTAADQEQGGESEGELSRTLDDPRSCFSCVGTSTKL